MVLLSSMDPQSCDVTMLRHAKYFRECRLKNAPEYIDGQIDFSARPRVSDVGVGSAHGRYGFGEGVSITAADIDQNTGFCLG